MNKMKLAEGKGRKLRSNLFESLTDDIVMLILCMLASSASSPMDYVNTRLTCKRLNTLGVNPMVLSNASAEMLAVKARNWCDEGHRFLKLCANAGNKEACYILGMIRFYCLHNRVTGASLMEEAGRKSHALALYSLALIKFNGSGGMKSDKDLSAGVALCAKAASMGHVDAIRELGHCFQEGYGVEKNTSEGRSLLIKAEACELADSDECEHLDIQKYNILEPKPHPANRFLAEWFEYGIVCSPLTICSGEGCGRPETRRKEFRRCCGCGQVNYCSRGCQARHWRMRHKFECAPVEDWYHGTNDVELVDYPMLENYDEDIDD